MDSDQIMMDMTQTVIPAEMAPEQKLTESLEQVEKSETVDAGASDANFVNTSAVEPQ